MRTGLLILALLLMPAPSGPSAMEVFLGTVDAVDREGGRVTLRVIDGTGETGEAQAVTVEIDPDRLPRNLRPGDSVRVWGDFMGPDRSVFQADTLRSGFGMGRRGDPTGVRSRLGRGRHGGRMGGRMGGGMGGRGSHR